MKSSPRVSVTLTSCPPICLGRLAGGINGGHDVVPPIVQMTSLASDGASRLDQEWTLQNQCKTMNFARCTLVEYFLGQLSCFSCVFSLIYCQPGRCSVPFPKSKMGTRSHHVQTHWAWTYILIWVWHWHGPQVESWFSSFIFGEKTENIHFDPYEAAKLVRQTEITP